MKTGPAKACFALGCLAASVASAAAGNIALNKPVVVVSGGASITNPSTPLSVVTDGTFTPESTAYHSPTAQAQAVEWGGAAAGTPTGDTTPTNLLLQIDLGADYTITGAIAQVDDNDAYLLQYLDPNSNTWQPLWDVPAISVGFGLRTRPNADQNTYQPVGPVVTSAVRISATAGDSGYAISELQLQGTLVPEPGTLAALAAAAPAAAMRPRRRRP